MNEPRRFTVGELLKRLKPIDSADVHEFVLDLEERQRGTFSHTPKRKVLFSGQEEVAKMKRLEAVAEAAEAYVDAGHGDEADPLLWDIVTALAQWREGKEECPDPFLIA